MKKKKRILIVDDERDVAMVMHHHLEGEDYEVEEAHNGAEALHRIFSGSFDLVLLDYQMRDIKGDRICVMARSDAKTENLPVIIVTAHTEVDEKQFKDYGASDVIYKPVTGHDLRAKIDRYFSNEKGEGQK